MRRFGLIGENLPHSFSPMIHNMIGGYAYDLYPLKPDKLSSFVKETDLDGFNVTIPYKKDIIPLCESLGEKAAEIGAVNTVVRLPNGGWHGENTDYYGFMRLLGADAARMKGKKALVLGSGGASLAVQAVLRDCGIPFVVVSRNGADNYENLSAHKYAALIVNTTPVGMYPRCGVSLLNPDGFSALRLVIDLIYNPARTELMLCAEERGIRAENGLIMLAAQAVKSAELFLNHLLPSALSQEIAAALTARTRNIVLIGMPGSGKTTIGRLISELTGRPFTDTDEAVCEKTHKTVSELFAEDGEKYFRQTETQVLKDIAQESGRVIAAGGGIVTVAENRRLIRQNGVCVYIRRATEKLETAGRPLSASEGVEALYRARAPLYAAWSDKTYLNEDAAQTAKQIAEDYNL